MYCPYPLIAIPLVFDESRYCVPLVQLLAPLGIVVHKCKMYIVVRSCIGLDLFVHFPAW